jgi:hypothetical protein
MGRADTALAEVSAPLLGMPVYLAGSLAAAAAHNMQDAWSDADVFCPSGEVLIATTQLLLCHNYKPLNDRYTRVWARWLRYGFKNWQTNSIKLRSPAGTEVNVIFKKVDGHPTTSLAQVFESFDFGLLGVGVELENGYLWRDLRSYLFPGTPVDHPLPLMPNKRTNWRNGFISQYNGLREPGRYAKYSRYGYDLSAVRDDLVIGYWTAADFHRSSGDPDKQKLGEIYERIAELINDDNIDQLSDASKQLLMLDELDAIMEALE